MATAACMLASRKEINQLVNDLNGKFNVMMMLKITMTAIKE
ncbi:hypothetical protein [Pantoea piersonii]